MSEEQAKKITDETFAENPAYQGKWGKEWYQRELLQHYQDYREEEPDTPEEELLESIADAMHEHYFESWDNRE